MRLSDIAQVIRSKTAGPRRLTLDLMFATDADYQRVAQSPALSRERIGVLYGLPADDVTVIPYPVGRAIKIVLARPIMAGEPAGRHVSGAQQHAPSLGVEICGHSRAPSPTCAARGVRCVSWARRASLATASRRRLSMQVLHSGRT